MTTPECVSIRIGGQICGVSVSEIHDAFRPAATNPVALSGPEIADVLNLRGRIVTAIDDRSRLGQLSQAKSTTSQRLAVGMERYGERFGPIINEFKEVIRREENALEQTPVNLNATWSDVSRGADRLEDRLLVMMDIDRMQAGAGAEDAAAAA